MTAVRLYIAQRACAAVMAPLVVLHLAVILYAIHGGLSGGEILARTHASWFWAAVYGLFVLAAAIHGSIGIRTIILEWTPLRASAANAVAMVFLAGLLTLGLRAVAAVVL